MTTIHRFSKVDLFVTRNKEQHKVFKFLAGKLFNPERIKYKLRKNKITCPNCMDDDWRDPKHLIKDCVALNGDKRNFISIINILFNI